MWNLFITVFQNPLQKIVQNWYITLGIYILHLDFFFEDPNFIDLSSFSQRYVCIQLELDIIIQYFLSRVICTSKNFFSAIVNLLLLALGERDCRKC